MKRLLPLLLWCAMHTASAQSLTHADSLLLRAQQISRQKDYPAAISAYQQVVHEPTAKPRYKAISLYNIACYYGLLKDVPHALSNLRLAIDAGYVSASHIAVDSDLNLLHTDPQWPKLLARARRLEEKTIIHRPEEVQLVTTDIDHFWQAYALARRDTAQAKAIFQRAYFGKASVGLQDYHQLKISSDAEFAQLILARPKYYGSIRPTTLSIAAQKPQIVAAFRRFQELYPALRFQNIYFVVGGWVSGGTVSDAGLLIGADQSANGPGVDTSELNLLQRNRCGQVTEMPSLLVHELVHRNQGPQDGTLLSYALSEGMADFVAELVTGHITNARLHPYGNAHEKVLWVDFQKEMGGTNSKNWIANGTQETPDKPCDLGYYVGYRIVQAYYNQAPDKKQALASILSIGDAKAFLAASGYDQAVARR
ncbi:MAG: TPR end-of-group domain-containing protein [Janthinobacterium lividum]